MVYADADYQGIYMRPELENKDIGFRFAMRPRKRRAVSDAAPQKRSYMISL